MAASLTAHEELIELREIFSGAEIADVLGITPETVSRMKSGRDVHRSTERALDDFHYVVHRLLSRFDGDGRKVRWAILRRQEALNGQSVVPLLQEGRIDEVLEVFEEMPNATDRTEMDDLRVSAELEAQLLALEQRPMPPAAAAAVDPVDVYLAAHPELRAIVPRIVETVAGYLGASEVQASVLADEDEDELVLTFTSELPLEESSERMRAFYADEWESLLAPVSDKIGIAVD